METTIDIFMQDCLKLRHSISSYGLYAHLHRTNDGGGSRFLTTKEDNQIMN